MARQLCPRCHYRRHKGKCVGASANPALLRPKPAKSAPSPSDASPRPKLKPAVEDEITGDPRCSVKACPYQAVVFGDGVGRCRAHHFELTTDVSLYASSL